MLNYVLQWYNKSVKNSPALLVTAGAWTNLVGRLDMDSIPQTSGVYEIRCSVNGKVYIGSAINLRRRKWTHWSELRNNRHHSRHLQSAWNKYGEAAFTFRVIELVLSAFVLDREQYWINKVRPYLRTQGYNSTKAAGSLYGHVHTAETKKRIGSNFAITWEGFINPDGEEVVIHNLREFCREHGLNPKTMCDLAHGTAKQYQHKGWTHKNRPPKVLNLPVYEGFIDPNGNPVGPIVNMAAFCAERGLNAGCMIGVYRGRPKCKSHKGWTCKRGLELEAA